MQIKRKKLNNIVISIVIGHNSPLQQFYALQAKSKTTKLSKRNKTMKIYFILKY